MAIVNTHSCQASMIVLGNFGCTSSDILGRLARYSFDDISAKPHGRLWSFAISLRAECIWLGDPVTSLLQTCNSDRYQTFFFLFLIKAFAFLIAVKV